MAQPTLTMARPCRRYHPKDVRWPGAHGEPDAELPPLPRHRERDDTVEADCGEDQPDGAEAGGNRSGDPHRGQAKRDRLFECLRPRDLHLRNRRFDALADARGKAPAAAGARHENHRRDEMQLLGLLNWNVDK